MGKKFSYSVNFNFHTEKLRNFNFYGFYRLLDAVTFLDATFKSRKNVVFFWESEVHHWKGLKKCYLKESYDLIITFGDIDKNVFTTITGAVSRIMIPASGCSHLIL